MSNAVLDSNGVVVNLIEGTAAGFVTVPNDGAAQIGGSWDGQQFHPAPTLVPQEVTRRQFMQALLATGLLDNAIAAVNGASRKVQLDWAHASTFRRDWPVLIAMAKALGKTDTDLDQVFILAGTINS